MRPSNTVPLRLAAVLLAILAATANAQGFFRETDLVSDVPGRAAQMDPALVNPWGLLVLPDGLLRVADNGTSRSTAYGPAGVSRGPDFGLPSGNPTGIVLNQFARAFKVTGASRTAPSRFIFGNEDGTIAAWNPVVDSMAVTVATTTDANYKGLALGPDPREPLLYAANFHSGAVDVFDGSFTKLDWTGRFVDPNLPAGYAPFNIFNVGHWLYIAFALPNDEGDDQHGPGLGYLDVFDLHGGFVKRLVSAGPLNAPWGMAVAPEGFGRLGGALLVGNFGDGHINAFDRRDGSFLGALSDSLGQPVVIQGLWGLTFRDGEGGDGIGGKDGGNRDAGQDQSLKQDDVATPDNGHDGREERGGRGLFFTAGIGEESHGLFGVMRFTGTRRHDDLAMRPGGPPVGAASQVQVRMGVAPVSGNPLRFSQSREVVFSVGTAGPARVDLGIYDVMGRRVAQPARGLEVTGATRVRWDRRDLSGTLVRAGTYFYRAETGSQVSTGRLVLLP